MKLTAGIAKGLLGLRSHRTELTVKGSLLLIAGSLLLFFIVYIAYINLKDNLPVTGWLTYIGAVLTYLIAVNALERFIFNHWSHGAEKAAMDKKVAAVLHQAQNNSDK